jgi:trans-2,3-dihydro-3-hydroxyanthranilate isomerase
MAEHPLLQVDAFTDRPLCGNPCAVVLDADGIDESTMLAVAREMNLSETAFVVRSERADVGARFFTPVGEIPMAGHPILATLFALVDAGRLRPGDGRAELTLELPAGVLPVEVEVCDGVVRALTMTQPAPAFGSRPDAGRTAASLGLDPSDLLPDLPVQVVGTGTPQLMVPLAGLEALRRVRPDPADHAALAREFGFFSTHAFVLGGVEAGDTFARHFAPGERGFEDPFTGSATGAMAAFLWRHGRLAGPRLVAEQGHWMRRPGRAAVEVLGPPDAITGVRVGGSAVAVLRGTLSL